MTFFYCVTFQILLLLCHLQAHLCTTHLMAQYFAAVTQLSDVTTRVLCGQCVVLRVVFAVCCVMTHVALCSLIILQVVCVKK